jgi:LPS export ABC transporter protein LptC
MLSNKFLRSCLRGDKYLSPFCVGILVSFLAWGCEGDKNKLGAEYKGPVTTVNNVVVKYSELGRLKVFMKSPLSLTFSNQNQVYPDTVNIDFYEPGGAIITHLRADSGRFDHSANLYTVMGNVKVKKFSENKTLATEELKWSPVTKKIFTDKPVVVRDFVTSEITKGVGMDADQDFSHIIIKKMTGIWKFVP